MYLVSRKGSQDNVQVENLRPGQKIQLKTLKHWQERHFFLQVDIKTCKVASSHLGPDVAKYGKRCEQLTRFQPYFPVGTSQDPGDRVRIKTPGGNRKLVDSRADSVIERA